MKSTRRRIVIALVVFLFLGYVVYRGADRHSDFRYQYGAARQFWKTGEIHIAAQPRYPITLHVMLAPLAALPLGMAVAVWAVVSFAAVAALPKVLQKLSGVEPRRQIVVWLLAGPFFLDALVLGQFDPINMLLVASGLVVARQGQGAIGAVLIGLAGMIKFLPLAHWTTLLARRPTLGVAAGMGLTVALGVGLVVAAVGWTPALAEIRAQAEWVQTREKPWHLVERGRDLRPNNESLPIVLARTFGDLPPGPRDWKAVSLARLPLSMIWKIWWAILATLGIGWLVSLRPAGRVDPARGDVAMFALTSIGMLAASPICWNHYFLWILPAALFLIHRRRLLIAAAIASLLVTAEPSRLARGMGGHMLIALGLFWIVVHDLRRESQSQSQGLGQSESEG